jgi:hypothetical protein
VPSHQSAANTVYKDDFFAGYSATRPTVWPARAPPSRSRRSTAPATSTIPSTSGRSRINGSAFSTIRLLCNGTTPTYTYWLATPAGLIDEPGAAAGDVVVTSLFQTASWTEAEIHDLTNGQYWVATDDAGGTAIDPGIGENEPYATASLPQFTPTTFSSVQVNGDYLGFESPSQYILNRGSGTLTRAAPSLTTGRSSL